MHWPALISNLGALSSAGLGLISASSGRSGSRSPSASGSSAVGRPIGAVAWQEYIHSYQLCGGCRLECPHEAKEEGHKEGEGEEREKGRAGQGRGKGKGRETEKDGGVKICLVHSNLQPSH